MPPPLFTKPLEEVDATDVAALIGWPESLLVEFKEDLSASGKGQNSWRTNRGLDQHAKDRLFKEIVAFANTSGGHLVLGIAETKDRPPTATKITPVPECVELADRLGKAAQAIDSPVPLLQVMGIPTEPDGSGVVVFRVPMSRSGPHRGTDKECYVRRDTNSVPVSMRDIQDMTLAGASRASRVAEQFRKLRDDYHVWFGSPCPSFHDPASHPSLVGFRVTAVPVGGDFHVARLYGRAAALDLRREYAGEYLSAGQTIPLRLPALNLPSRERPILRGTRLEEGNVLLTFFDCYTDGSVNVGFRWHVSSADESKLYLGWVAAYMTNVLRAADRLRDEAGLPECEYAVEVEIASTGAMIPGSGARLVPGPDIGVIGWLNNDSESGHIGAITNSGLTLPRLSFGPIAELSGAISQMSMDIHDAIRPIG